MKKIKGPSLEEMVKAISRRRQIFASAKFRPRLKRRVFLGKAIWFIPGDHHGGDDFSIILDIEQLPLAMRPMNEEELASWHTALMIANET